MFKFGIIGYGYWGPNVARNCQIPEFCELVSISDRRPEALRRARQAFPQAQLTTEPNDVLKSEDIDAVAIVTPVWTHFELAKAALENGKHVFVEKPFTSTTVEAEELIEIASSRNLQIMVDHTFLFTGAVKKMRQLVDDGTLGRLYYYDSTRVNLGLFQHDVDVIWDLAPHDLSIMDYVIQKDPEALVATGERHLNGHADVAYITIYFPDNVIAHINVNWLSPVKVRTTLLGGEKKMLVWNDLDADEKIKVYDKGVAVTGGKGVYDLLVSYRSGDMWCPKIEQTEALGSEIAYFVECVSKGTSPMNDGIAGLRVVKLLESAAISLKERGAIVRLTGMSGLPCSTPLERSQAALWRTA
jgi:predicted dehydrogenase